MARIKGVLPAQAGLQVKIAYHFTRRSIAKLTGRETERMIEPLEIYARVPVLFKGYAKLAAELSVSVNTVSTHLRSIYAKLLVSDRSSAVQRARELRLLAVARQESRTADHWNQLTAAHLDGR
jgi:hypothetical protein